MPKSLIRRPSSGVTKLGSLGVESSTSNHGRNCSGHGIVLIMKWSSCGRVELGTWPSSDRNCSNAPATPKAHDHYLLRFSGFTVAPQIEPKNDSKIHFKMDRKSTQNLNKSEVQKDTNHVNEQDRKTINLSEFRMPL